MITGHERTVMPSNELPDGFFNWVVGAVAAVVTTLVATVTTLWRVNESKNAKAIEEQSKQIVHIEAELNIVREHAKTCDEARVLCERDRAVLGAKCEMFEKRLSELEAKSA
jgi:hypothetical protein